MRYMGYIGVKYHTNDMIIENGGSFTRSLRTLVEGTFARHQDTGSKFF